MSVIFLASSVAPPAAGAVGDSHSGAAAETPRRPAVNEPRKLECWHLFKGLTISSLVTVPCQFLPLNDAALCTASGQNWLACVRLSASTPRGLRQCAGTTKRCLCSAFRSATAERVASTSWTSANLCNTGKWLATTKTSFAMSLARRKVCVSLCPPSAVSARPSLCQINELVKFLELTWILMTLAASDRDYS